MNELLDKISSYNVFNYLLPGTLFAVLATKLTSYQLVQDDLLTAAFLYYFVGLVVSRVGSLVVEPVLKRIGFVTFAPYSDFVATSSEDSKLEVLSEVNNMYRTLASLFLLLAVTTVFERFARSSAFLTSAIPYLLVASMLILFLFSYRKQTKYITGRIETRTGSRD